MNTLKKIHQSCHDWWNKKIEPRQYRFDRWMFFHPWTSMIISLVFIAIAVVCTLLNILTLKAKL